MRKNSFASGLASLAIFFMFSVFSLDQSRASEDLAKKLEAVSKICLGEYVSVQANQVVKINIDGRIVEVSNNNNTMDVKIVNGPLIEGLKYETATQYNDCLDRIIKALGISDKSGLKDIEVPVILARDFPCSTDNPYRQRYLNDVELMEFFSSIAANEDKIVYLDFNSWVGGSGCETIGNDTENEKNGENRILHWISFEQFERTELDEDDLQFTLEMQFNLHQQFDSAGAPIDDATSEKLFEICEKNIKNWICPTTAGIAFPDSTNAVLRRPNQSQIGVKGLVRVSVDGKSDLLAITLHPVETTDRLMDLYDSISTSLPAE